jgi:hypothetical protein
MKVFYLTTLVIIAGCKQANDNLTESIKDLLNSNTSELNNNIAAGHNNSEASRSRSINNNQQQYYYNNSLLLNYNSNINNFQQPNMQAKQQGTYMNIPNQKQSSGQITFDKYKNEFILPQESKFL